MIRKVSIKKKECSLCEQPQTGGFSVPVFFFFWKISGDECPRSLAGFVEKNYGLLRKQKSIVVFGTS